MRELARFRAEIDDFMAHHPQSPLGWDQQQTFQGLDYYPENSELRFELEAERFPADEPIIELETNTGDIRAFRRWGRITFLVEGQEASLTIYSDPHQGDFFLPFKDATNGRETYGAGRYLDDHRPGLRHLGDNQIEIDFNYAYNPYCAYNEHYSCPLPPAENWLKVPIRAGEKDFKK